MVVGVNGYRVGSGRDMDFNYILRLMDEIGVRCGPLLDKTPTAQRLGLAHRYRSRSRHQSLFVAISGSQFPFATLVTYFLSSDPYYEGVVRCRIYQGKGVVLIRRSQEV